MNIPFYIARRYFFAKKSHNVINIISAISMVGVAVGTMGLIVVLSVFNGFGNTVLSLYEAFDPDFKITPKKGKSFVLDEQQFDKLQEVEGVDIVVKVLEENALFKYNDKQFLGRIKGVSPEFSDMVKLENNMLEGTYKLQAGDSNFAVIGSYIAYSLAVNPNDPYGMLSIYVPRKGKISMSRPESAFHRKMIKPAGIFGLQQDFDSEYVIVPIRFASSLLSSSDRITAFEIQTKRDADNDDVKADVAAIMGSEFDVKDSIEQHDFLYQILRSEKWAVYLILTFILLIATFNMLGSLTMLIIEKKADLFTLISMGADSTTLKRIFLNEGLIISMTGALIGLSLGFVLCFLQEKFGLIAIENSESFVVESYPVNMQLMDFVAVFVTVFVIGFLASWFTSEKIVKQQVPSHLQY